MKINLKKILNDISLDSDGRFTCGENAISELTTEELSVISGGSINANSCTNGGTCGSTSKNNVCSNTGNCTGSTNSSCGDTTPAPTNPSPNLGT